MYTCSGSGTYLLHLWFRDERGEVHELPDSPHVLTVIPSCADSRGCLLFEGGNPLHGRTLPAGSLLTSYIQVADKYGNPTTPAEGELEVTLEGPHGARRLSPKGWHADGDKSATPKSATPKSATPKSATPKSATPKSAGAANPSHVGLGTYEICEELTLSGKYKLTASLIGDTLVGSPIELTIKPAAPDGLSCLLIPPPHAAIAHEPATFVVQPRDQFGNLPPASELQQAVALGAVVARCDGPTRPRCAVRARADGSLDVTVLAELSGEYRLHVWVSGTQLPACPYTLRVHANRASIRDGNLRPVHGAVNAPNVVADRLGGVGAPWEMVESFRSPRSASPPKGLPKSPRAPKSPKSPSSTMDVLQGSAMKSAAVKSRSPSSPHAPPIGPVALPHAPVFTPAAPTDPTFIPASEAPLPHTAPRTSPPTSAAYLINQPATPRARVAALLACEDDGRWQPAPAASTTTSEPEIWQEIEQEPASASFQYRRHKDVRKAATPRTAVLLSDHRARNLSRTSFGTHDPSPNGNGNANGYANGYASGGHRVQGLGSGGHGRSLRRTHSDGSRMYSDLIAQRGGPISPSTPRSTAYGAAVVARASPRGSASPRPQPSLYWMAAGGVHPPPPLLA